MACDRVTLQGTEAPKAVTNFPSERVGPSEACQPEALRPLQVTRRKDGRALSTHTWDQVKAQHPEEHSRAGCPPRSLGPPPCHGVPCTPAACQAGRPQIRGWGA